MPEAAAVALATLQNKLLAFGPSVPNLGCVEAVFPFPACQLPKGRLRDSDADLPEGQQNFSDPCKGRRADSFLWTWVFLMGSLVNYICWLLGRQDPQTPYNPGGFVSLLV